MCSPPVPAAASPASCSHPKAVAEEPAWKDVRLLYADSMLLPANAVVDRELRSALGKDAATPVRIYTEALDLSWFPDKEVERAMLVILRLHPDTRRIAFVSGGSWVATVVSSVSKDSALGGIFCPSAAIRWSCEATCHLPARYRLSIVDKSIPDPYRNSNVTLPRSPA